MANTRSRDNYKSSSAKMDASKLSGRVMPNNLEAEQSVLGCAMIDRVAAEHVVGHLKGDDFYSQTHSVIFEAMEKLYRKNAPIDFVSVIDSLGDRLESVGGVNYITTLANSVPSSAYYVHYTKIVKQNSILRQLIHLCNKLTLEAYDADDLSVVDKAEKLIYELGEKNITGGLENMRSAFNDSMSAFEDIHKNGSFKRGIRSGLIALDKKTGGFQNSDLIILAARPGIGKTSLAMNIVTNAAINDKAKCAIFNLEMSAVQLAQRMLCGVAGVDMGKARNGDLTENDWVKLWKAHKKLMDTEIYCDANSMNKPSNILSQCRKLKREHGLDFIVVDYLQLMTGDRSDEGRQNEVSDMSRQMKILAKEINVPVLVLSQLKRPPEDKSISGKSVMRKPRLTDLRESGSIEQDADMVIFIDRKDISQGQVVESDDYTAELIIAKFRNGQPGSVNVGWDGSRTSFVNLAGDANAASLEATYESMHATPDGAMPEGFDAFADMPASELPTDFDALAGDVANNLGNFEDAPVMPEDEVFDIDLSSAANDLTPLPDDGEIGF